MKVRYVVRFFYLSLLLAIGISCSHHPEEKWSYAGSHAPYSWGGLDSSFMKCSDGKTQSPIDLDRTTALTMSSPIEFSYENLKGHAVNDGKTIRLEFEDEDSVFLQGKKYYLRQLHFHAKSEHSIDGLYYPAEMHLVHFAADGELLVLAFFIKIDDTHGVRFEFFNELPEEGEKKQTQLISLRKLEALNGPHFFYKGSLTTPPCTESVNWVVFEKPVTLGYKQLAAFSSIYSSNYRPTVPLSEHKVFYSR